MKTVFGIMIILATFLVGCDDGGPEDIIEDHGPTIVISALPEGLGASWVLTGPDGYSLSDTGSILLEGVETGDYSLAWGAVEGWRNAPLDEIKTLVEDSFVVFVGEYTNDLPVASTPDKLLQNFEEIYSRMLVDKFPDLLHPDFQFILSPGMQSDWGWEPGSTFDFDTMITIHENMFSGLPGTDHHGNGIQPLDRIELLVFERIGEWVVLPGNDPEFPGTSRALYDIKIYFHDNSGFHAFAVEQQVNFYASSVDGIWYLQGMRALENYQGKAIENASYDSILALYQ